MFIDFTIKVVCCLTFTEFPLCTVLRLISISSRDIELFRVAILSVCISCGDLGIQRIFSFNLSCPIYWHKIALDVPLLFFYVFKVISSLPFSAINNLLSLYFLIVLPRGFWILLMFSKLLISLFANVLYMQKNVDSYAEIWFVIVTIIIFILIQQIRVMWLFRVPTPFPWDVEQRHSTQTFYSERQRGREEVTTSALAEEESYQ